MSPDAHGHKFLSRRTIFITSTSLSLLIVLLIFAFRPRGITDDKAAEVTPTGPPVFDAAHFDRTRQWLRQLLQRLDNSRQRGNDLVYKEILEAVASELRATFPQEVAWELPVLNVSQDFVELQSDWGELQQIDRIHSDRVDDVKLRLSETAAPIRLAIGQGINLEQARSLKRGDAVLVNAKISEFSIGQPKGRLNFASMMTGRNPVVLTLSDARATPKRGGKHRNGKRQGKWTILFPNGEVREVGDYQDGTRVGQWVEYYPNGTKASEGDFKRGQLNGPWSYYHDNGQKAMECKFRDGEEYGFSTFWTKNGQPYPLRKIIKFGNEGMVDDIAFRPDGEELAVVVRGGLTHVSLWDLQMVQESTQLHEPEPEKPRGRQKIKGVAYTPDCQHIFLTTGPFSETVYILDTKERRVQRILAAPGEKAKRIYELRFSDDGSTFAAVSSNSGNWNRIISLWDTTSGRQLQLVNVEKGFSWPRGQTGIADFAYDRKGERIVYGTQGGSVGIWRPGEPKEHEIRDLSPYSPAAVTFLENGEIATLCKASKQPPILVVFAPDAEGNYQMKSQCEVSAFNGPAVFDYQGKRLAVAQQGNIDLYDVQSGKKLLTITKVHTKIDILVFSRDGAYLASSGDGSDLKLWDLH